MVNSSVRVSTRDDAGQCAKKLRAFCIVVTLHDVVGTLINNTP